MCLLWRIRQPGVDKVIRSTRRPRTQRRVRELTEVPPPQSGSYSRYNVPSLGSLASNILSLRYDIPACSSEMRGLAVLRIYCPSTARGLSLALRQKLHK